jgi:hypothetical protein
MDFQNEFLTPLHVLIFVYRTAFSARFHCLTYLVITLTVKANVHLMDMCHYFQLNIVFIDLRTV